MQKKILLLVGVALLGAAGLWFALAQDSTRTNDDDTFVVGASYYIPQHFVEKVGGDNLELLDVASSGSAHDFEPSAKDIATLQSADIFFYNGAGLDTWAERIVDDLETNGVTTVELVESITLIETSDEDEHAHDEEEEAHSDEEEGHDHDHGPNDPHVWNDPMNAIAIVEVIRDEFVRLDPENADSYNKNAELYIGELRELDSQITRELSGCQFNDVIVAHDAFAYFGERYGITMHPISGLSPEAEPSPKRIAELSELVNELGLSYVFFETTSSPRTAETIASETGAETLVMHPLGGLTEDEREEGKDYISIMNENVENLKMGLECL